MESIPYLAWIVVSVLTWLIALRPFFGKEKDFWECVGYSLKPDLFSWSDGEMQRDYGKSLKLVVFLVLVIGSGYLAYCIADLVISK